MFLTVIVVAAYLDSIDYAVWSVTVIILLVSHLRFSMLTFSKAI